MKEVQKKITILIWFCSIAITFMALISQFTPYITRALTCTMFTVAMTATILYFIPISEYVKAILVLVMTGLATLVASILLDGNSGTFMASFMVLGMAALYFNPVILVTYSFIYLTASIIVYLINSAYIVGGDVAPYMGIVEILSYALMTGCLYIATRYGRKYMNDVKMDQEDAQEKATIIEQQTNAVQENSVVLYEKVDHSDNAMKRLSKEANEANESIGQVKNSEIETIERFNIVNGTIETSTEWIEKNYELIETLKDNYTIALENVEESKEFSTHASESMDQILSAIDHAHGSVTTLSGETAKISSIIKEINDIATQTNLLAINASIEAARVDRKGTGFDIVAEQIRTLSVQSKQASENINNILIVLSEALQATEEKVNKGKRAVQYGIRNLNQMVQCIDTIDLYSKQSKDTLNQEIMAFQKIKEAFSTMVEEVESSKKSSERNLTDLEGVVDLIRSQTNKTEQVSMHLNEMQELANQVVSQF